MWMTSLLPVHLQSSIPQVALNLSLPAPPGRGERQGLWEESEAGRVSPGRHKSPDKVLDAFSSSLRILIFDWTCSPASGPRSWETGLGPFPLLEPGSQGRFLQSATSIIFHGNLNPSINRFLNWSVYRPPDPARPLHVSNHCTGRS